MDENSFQTRGSETETETKQMLALALYLCLLHSLSLSLLQKGGKRILQAPCRSDAAVPDVDEGPGGGARTPTRGYEILNT